MHNKSQKRILLLGGSAQQTIAIQTAKDLGYYTVLADYLPDNPGQYIADKFFPASTTDISAVYDIAKKEEVDGILAYASDPAALPAAIVAEKLGLPGNSSNSIEVLGLKHPWRHFLSENGFACPKAFTFHPETPEDDIKNGASGFSFPLVIKPTDSSGSKGVTMINRWESLSEAIAHADAYSRNKILIIEEYIQRGFPSVIGGDIFIWKGKIVLFGEMECLRDEKISPLIPIGKKWPINLSELQRNRIHSELQRVVDALGIRFGEMNIEILLDTEDNVHFLELGPRAGGNMIPIQLSDIYGIDLVKANIQAAMGEEPDFIHAPLQSRSGCYMHYVLHSYNAGTFKGVSFDESIRDSIYRQVIYKTPGDFVDFFDSAAKALGIIFLHFNTVEDMEYFCKNHNSLINIELQ